MKRLPMILFVGAVVLSSLAVGCRDENDPEYWLEYMYDRPWREKSLKTLNEIFSKTMQENDNDLQSPAVKKLVDLMVPELVKAYKDFTRDKFNRSEIIKLLAQMKDDRALEVFMDGLSAAESGDSLTFTVSAAAVQRQAVEQAVPKILAAHQKIVSDRSRRPGAPFTVSENEIEESVISATSQIIVKHPGSSHTAAVVKMLREIAETSDELQDLRLNMKAFKEIGRIGDPAGIPTLIKGIAFKGRRQPIGLGQIAFSALQQVRNRDAVVDAMLAFAKREDASFNAFYANEMKSDLLMSNPTWYIQQAAVLFGELNYASPKVISFLEAELNHEEPDEIDATTAALPLQVQFDASGWATMRRNWAAVALAEMGHKPVLNTIINRMSAKKGKLGVSMEEAVGYVRALGILLYPNESCDVLLRAAKGADDSMRDKTYYNASLMCGDDFLTAIKKDHDKIDCDKIVADRFPGDSGTDEEKKSAYNECDIMKKRLSGYMETIKFGIKCAGNVECFFKELKDKKGTQKERAVFGLYQLARDNPGKQAEVVKLLIERLDDPNKAALKASVFALDRLTPNGGKELEDRIQEVHKKIKLSYKAEARDLESFIGRVRNRGRK